MTRISRSLAAATALLVAVTACSSSGSGKDGPSPGKTARLIPIPGKGGNGAPIPNDPRSRQAAAALVTPRDLPSRFQQAAYPTSLPQPCAAKNAKPVLAQVPAVTHVSRALVTASPQAVLTEEIDVFRSADDAARTVAVITGAMSCAKGDYGPAGDSGKGVAIDGPRDISSVVGIRTDAMFAWTMQNAQITVSFVATRFGKVLTALTLLAPSNADLSKLPSGPAVTRTALTKVLGARLG